MARYIYDGIHEIKLYKGEFLCCICKEVTKGLGNNPDPVTDEAERLFADEALCCDKCNDKVVIPKRLGVSMVSDLTRVWKAGIEAIRKYPDICDDVTDAFELMRDEISDGSSQDLEEERFLEQLDYLIAKEKS